MDTHRHLDTIARCTEGRGVALVDDDTKLADTAGGVARVGDTRDGRAGSIGLRLDAQSLVAGSEVPRSVESTYIMSAERDVLVDDGVPGDSHARDGGAR